jgi:Tfp pilus assembly protein PilF
MNHARPAILLLASLTLFSAGCGGKKKRLETASKMQQLGTSKLREGDAESAVADLTQAMKLDPKNAETRHLLGMAYWAKGKVISEDSLMLEGEQHILASFKLVGKEVPGDWHNNLGALYVDLRRWPEAVVELQKALKDPEYRTPERPLNNLAKASLEQHKYAEALEYAERSLKIQPRFCTALINKAEALKALKRNEDALEPLLKLIEIEECTTWAEPYLRIGLIYLEMKRTNDAKQNLLKAKQADPDGPIGKEADRYLRSIGR